jgi:hypothetical protein
MHSVSRPEEDSMSDRSGEEHGRPANEGVNEDVRSHGDEGRRTAETTPPIADDARHEQTQSPAPADDVGVPSDEELGRDEEIAQEDE